MDEILTRRCFDLARLGTGKVRPNPLVGSVLLFNNTIIGEGYHQRYGQAHAEVNCLNSVSPADRDKIADSQLYVSLEPCCFHGNTPACTDLILNNKIKKVHIGTLDATPQVAGKGRDILIKKGITVSTHKATAQADWLVRFRNCLVTKNRPYIILKYAVSKDGFMGLPDRPIWLTNPVSKRLVHKWRSESAAILVGTNTALIDNPALTNRLFYGDSPLRVVLDRQHRIPADYQLKNDQHPTWIISETPPEKIDFQQTHYKKIPFDKELLPQLLQELYEAKKDSLIVEGGAALLGSFIKAGLWDEARIFHTQKILGKGILAPELEQAQERQRYWVGNDEVVISERVGECADRRSMPST